MDARQFWDKTTNCPKLPHIHATVVDFIVMQMSRVDREKGYW